MHYNNIDLISCFHVDSQLPRGVTSMYVEIFNEVMLSCVVTSDFTMLLAIVMLLLMFGSEFVSAIQQYPRMIKNKDIKNIY